MTIRCHETYKGQRFYRLETLRRDPSGDCGDHWLVSFNEDGSDPFTINEFDTRTVLDQEPIKVEEVEAILVQARCLFHRSWQACKDLAVWIWVTDQYVLQAQSLLRGARYEVRATELNYGWRLEVERP